MCAHFPKAEDETLEATKQPTREAFVAGKSNFEKMKTTPRVYMTIGEYSVQEAVYLVMPELWL